MDPLAISSLGPATLSALSALRPPQALAIPAQTGDTPGSTTLSLQDLAQGLFQRTLQVATSFPVAEPATGSASLAQAATASLFAALNAPQATASPTPTPDATSNPAAVQAQAPIAAGTAPTPTPTLAADLPAIQDTFATGSSLDFALQTALRFGAGVAPLAAPAVSTPALGPGLVRDAAAVLRLENLQPRSGGPGPEAFTQFQPAVQQVLRSYAVPALEGPVGLDLMA